VEVNAPEPGSYSLRIWLEDAARNVDRELSSGTVLKFDDGLPGRAHFDAPLDWLNGDQADDLELSLTLEPNGYEPVSGVAGYSITSDGSAPDDSLDVGGALSSIEMRGLAEGVTVLRARTISNSGVPASAVGSASVKVDRTPPAVRVDGLPESDKWRRQAVHGQIVSADQPTLSGVDPAPSDMSLTDGGYLSVLLDGTVREVRGSHAAVPITTDGHHTLTFRAFDAAGNGSVQKEVAFKIDGTAPVGSFRALDGADPRQLRVDVADATSGVADGRIEYQREGGGGFQRLATARQGGVLLARLDDERLPAGRYELRAVVTDVAGNEVVIDDWANGAAATLEMPLRSEAKVSVAREPATLKRCVRTSKKGHGKRKRSRPLARPKCGGKALPKASLGLGHGKAAHSTGSVTTRAGAPLVDAPVIVEGQARSGGAFVSLGVARTDRQGRFRFKIPAGPSRTVRYRYDGTNTVKPAAAQLVTKVRAAARLKASRRRLRNGQVVRFTGRLLGRPIPAAGKVVALQAKVGRRWRTFATPRANAKGLFRHRYRFTATTGLRRYVFRAVVTREAAYPYERGVSRRVTVIVRGANRG
jgi:hypothetical protein